MTMQRWRPGAMRPLSPFRDLEEMEKWMDEVFSEWPWRIMWRRAPGDGMAWSPSIDMYEKGDRLIILAELPGVSKDEVDISMSGDVLTIKGERKPPADVKDEEYQRSEMRYGPFSRSITLPVAVDAEKIEATFENGMLEISLARAREAMPTRVQIKVK